MLAVTEIVKPLNRKFCRTCRTDITSRGCPGPRVTEPDGTPGSVAFAVGGWPEM